MRAHISNQDYENLSAYLDGQLAPGERRKLEERMRARPDLKVALEELSRTRAMIRMVPRRRAPRNFTLTPAMVGDIGPRRRRASFSSLFPALSFASALATLVLVATLVLELAPGVNRIPSSQAPSAAMEPMADGQAELRAQQEQTEQDSALQAPGEESVSPAPEMGIMEAPQAKAAGSEMAALPPVITWNDPNAPLMDSGRYGMGGGGGGSAPAPMYPYGMGGGGPGEVIEGLGGGEGSLPGGGLILPLEAAESFADEYEGAAAAEEQPAAAAEISGSGPILGLPSTEEAGQIEMQSAFGQPIESEPDLATNQASEAEEQPAAADELPAAEPTAPSSLRMIQALLALLAIISGVAAFFVHRNRA